MQHCWNTNNKKRKILIAQTKSEEFSEEFEELLQEPIRNNSRIRLMVFDQQWNQNKIKCNFYFIFHTKFFQLPRTQIKILKHVSEKKFFQKLKKKRNFFSRRDRRERLRVKQAAAKWQQYRILWRFDTCNGSWDDVSEKEWRRWLRKFSFLFFFFISVIYLFPFLFLFFIKIFLSSKKTFLVHLPTNLPCSNVPRAVLKF